jgi:hypothetical protein
MCALCGMLLRRSPHNLGYVEIFAGQDGLRPTASTTLRFHVTYSFTDLARCAVYGTAAHSLIEQALAEIE